MSLKSTAPIAEALGGISDLMQVNYATGGNLFGSTGGQDTERFVMQSLAKGQPVSQIDRTGLPGLVQKTGLIGPIKADADEGAAEQLALRQQHTQTLSDAMAFGGHVGEMIRVGGKDYAAQYLEGIKQAQPEMFQPGSPYAIFDPTRVRQLKTPQDMEMMFRQHQLDVDNLKVTLAGRREDELERHNFANEDINHLRTDLQATQETERERHNEVQEGINQTRADTADRNSQNVMNRLTRGDEDKVWAGIQQRINAAVQSASIGKPEDRERLNQAAMYVMTLRSMNADPQTAIDWMSKNVPEFGGGQQQSVEPASSGFSLGGVLNSIRPNGNAPSSGGGAGLKDPF